MLPVPFTGLKLSIKSTGLSFAVNPVHFAGCKFSVIDEAPGGGYL